MKAIPGVLMIMSLLLCQGCRNIWGVQSTSQAGARAAGFRAEAASYRKDARDHALARKMTEREIEKCQARLDAMEKEKKKLEGLLQSITEERMVARHASPQELQGLDKSIEVYADKKRAVQATIDDDRILLRNLQTQLREQQRIHEGFIWLAEQKEKEAADIEQYALEMSQK